MSEDTRTSFPPGWLKDQLDQAEESPKQWPDWMRREAGLPPMPASYFIQRALDHPDCSTIARPHLGRALWAQQAKEQVSK